MLNESWDSNMNIMNDLDNVKKDIRSGNFKHCYVRRNSWLEESMVFKIPCSLEMLLEGCDFSNKNYKEKWILF